MERSCERTSLLRFDGGISILRRSLSFANILVCNSRDLLMTSNLSRTPRTIHKKNHEVYLESLETEHYSLKFAKTCGFIF